VQPLAAASAAFPADLAARATACTAWAAAAADVACNVLSPVTQSCLFLLPVLAALPREGGSLRACAQRHSRLLDRKAKSHEQGGSRHSADDLATLVRAALRCLAGGTELSAEQFSFVATTAAGQEQSHRLTDEADEELHATARQAVLLSASSVWAAMADAEQDVSLDAFLQAATRHAARAAQVSLLLLGVAHGRSMDHDSPAPPARMWPSPPPAGLAAALLALCELAAGSEAASRVSSALSPDANAREWLLAARPEAAGPLRPTLRFTRRCAAGKALPSPGERFVPPEVLHFCPVLRSSAELAAAIGQPLVLRAPLEYSLPEKVVEWCAYHVPGGAGAAASAAERDAWDVAFEKSLTPVGVLFTLINFAHDMGILALRNLTCHSVPR